MKQIIWKPIPQFPGYFASNTGLIKNSKNHIMSTSRANSVDNHLKVKLTVNGKRTTQFVHRLVLMAFNFQENYQTLQVNHIDGNPENNYLENLEWCTPKENHDHYKNVLIPDRKKQGIFKTNTPDILKYEENYYYGEKELCEELNISRTTCARWKKEGKITKVNEVPLGHVNKKIQVKKRNIPKPVRIDYFKKESEFYKNCKEADLALELPVGTIQRWAKRNWKKMNSGKVQELGIKFIEVIEDPPKI